MGEDAMKTAEMKAWARAMKTAEMKAWARAARSPVGYNPAAKEEFLRGARAFANELVKRLGLDANECRIRRNDGGIAVSGEVMIYTAHVFVSIEQSTLGGFYYRTCDKLGDSGSGMRHTNRWIQWSDIVADPEAAIMRIVGLFERTKQERAAG